MTANFWKWEVDPFFAAAEDVQESTDRLESSYRTWIHATSLLAAAPHDLETLAAIGFRRRHLITALGTAKWQVEEFERAVTQAALGGHVDDDDAPARHKQFVQAISNKIAMIEKGMADVENEVKVRPMPALKLEDDEKDVLAKFLSGTNSATAVMQHVIDFQRGQDGSPDVSSASKHSGHHVLCADTLLPTTMARDVSEIKTIDVSSSPINMAFNTKDIDCQFLHLPSKDGNTLANIFSESCKQHIYEKRIICEKDKNRGSFEGINERQRSVTVSSGLNQWKVEALPRKADDTTPRRCNSVNNNLTLWALFSKKKRPVNTEYGFKRWKDGDTDSSYSSVDKVGYDMESGITDVCHRDKKLTNDYALGPIFIGEERPRWGLQRSQHPFSSIQLASVILVVLGFIGLLSFQATTSF